jgi:hypothetical protein
MRGVVAIACAMVGCGGGAAGGDASSSASTSVDASSGDLPSECDGCGDDTVCLGGACVPLVPCASDDCAHGPAFALPDTDLRVCYGPSPDGSDGTIACPAEIGTAACAGVDYCGGDAQYGWDVAHVQSERFMVVAGDEPIVVDAITQREWQGCVSGQSGAGCSGDAVRVDWYTAEAYCNDATWGGHDDWQLPSSYELQSITDYGTTSPAIDTAAFVNAPSSFAADPDQWWIECEWSASDYAGDPEVAWALMVNNGDVAEGSGLEYHLHDKPALDWEGCYVRCVRAAPQRTWQRFVKAEVAGEPIVADTATGLQWQGCSLGQSGPSCSEPATMVDWRTALSSCEALSWSGHDDWRLPNIIELRSLVDERTQSPAIDTAMFPGTPYYGVGMTDTNVGQYWSSTARSYNSFALYVDFGFGFSHFYEQPEGRHVRCVR